MQLLEDEGIVQSSGQQVGEGVENENVLRGKGAVVAAFDVQRAQQSFAVGDGNAKHGARLGQDRADLAFYAVLHQRALAGARHAAENSDAQRNALAHGVSGGSGFCFDFDFFGAVIEQADTDVIEAEILLDFSDDLAQHDGRDRRSKLLCARCC